MIISLSYAPPPLNPNTFPSQKIENRKLTIVIYYRSRHNEEKNPIYVNIDITKKYNKNKSCPLKDFII